MSKKYYFIAYASRYRTSITWDHDNSAAAVHPIKWQGDVNRHQTDVLYRVTGWQEISRDEFKKYEGELS